MKISSRRVAICGQWVVVFFSGGLMFTLLLPHWLANPPPAPPPLLPLPTLEPVWGLLSFTSQQTWKKHQSAKTAIINTPVWNSSGLIRHQQCFILLFKNLLVPSWPSTPTLLVFVFVKILSTSTFMVSLHCKLNLGRDFLPISKHLDQWCYWSHTADILWFWWCNKHN